MTRENPPCAQRLDNGGWCVLDDKHQGSCEGVALQHGPKQSIWNRHKGRMIICGKVTGPATVCGKQRGHGGEC